MSTQNKPLILVTGATGYVGGRLVPRLLDAGYRVRVMTRDVRHLQGRTWLDEVEVAQGDVLDKESLAPILEGVDAAYYMIHSMGSGSDFEERDATAARNFAHTAKDAGVQQIVYLGGLGDPDNEILSDHLSSRQKVGQILREEGQGVTEFRASVVVGAGSLSFEMVRYLTELVPFMICPRWVYTDTQPIAIDDVLRYMVAALDTPESHGQVIEIGGESITTYYHMMTKYAEARELTRFMIPVPFLTPRLSSYWVHFITPVDAKIVRPLIDGLKNTMIADTAVAEQLFPQISPMSYEEALDIALSELNAQQVETSWTDSMAATWELDEPYTFVEKRGMMIEQRKRHVNADPNAVYESFTSLGGETGWLYLNWLWHLRGTLDRILGGPGYRRGKREDGLLRAGDTLDFWRVEAVEQDHLLRLRAEMKLPGRGWLQFVVEPAEDGGSNLVQTAYFAPKGLFGFIYWYSLFFLHKFIFDGMIDRIVEQAEVQDMTTTMKKRRLRLAPLAVVLTVIPALILLFVLRLLDRD